MTKGKILVFGTPFGDKVGSMALDIVQEQGFPIDKFHLGEEYKKNVLVAFFSPEKQSKNHNILKSTAHNLLNESITVTTPLIVACYPRAEMKMEEFEKAIKIIATSYMRWGMLGFPMLLPNNRIFPPWGVEPNGQVGHPKTTRQKNFLLWKEEVEKYLKSFR